MTIYEAAIHEKATKRGWDDGKWISVHEKATK